MKMQGFDLYTRSLQEAREICESMREYIQSVVADQNKEIKNIDKNMGQLVE